MQQLVLVRSKIRIVTPKLTELHKEVIQMKDSKAYYQTYELPDNFMQLGIPISL